jgi:hypothetical protein
MTACVRPVLLVGLVAAVVFATPSAGAAPAMEPASCLGGLGVVRTLGSTVPANGDLNPYGVVVVPTSAGALRAGNILVSNFNARSNNQGTGDDDRRDQPRREEEALRDGQGERARRRVSGWGRLDTALAILPGGYVVVGSLPTMNGHSATAKAGCLIVLNSSGCP